MSNEPLPQSEIILYQTEDGRTRVQCRFENETLWLTQAQIAELFQTTPQNVTLHLKVIFAEGGPDWVKEPAMTDCDGEKVVQLLDTQSYFDLLHLPYPATCEAVLERFASERLIERSGGAWTISNLGALLFAKKLESFDRLARKAPRVIVYEGTNKLKTKLDKSGPKGYAVAFQGLVEFINGLVPSNEVIEQALRREVKMFPEIAVRELVANALIHQDINESGMSVMVEI